jgi:hypothetical protein
MPLLKKARPILSNVSRAVAIVLIFALCAPGSVQEDQNTQRHCVNYVPKYAMFVLKLVKYTRRNIAKNVQRLAELVLQNVPCKNKAGIRFLPYFLSFISL